MSGEERYASLIEVLPKKPELWSMDDVESWLVLIRMDKYLEKFSKSPKTHFSNFPGEMAIDGYLILELTEEDLEAEMGVTVKLHRRKLIKG